MVGVATSGPVALTINPVVRDRNTATSAIAKNDMLTTNQRGGAVVDPDVISAIKSNSVSSPDNVRVKVGNVDVLDDDVLNTVGETKALALDDTLRANTDDTLVRSNHNRVQTRLIILDGNLGGVGLIVGTPVVLVDSSLAIRASTPRSAACFTGRVLSTLEVESAVKVNDTRGVIAKILDKFGVGLGVDGLAAFATSGTGSKAFGLGGKSGERAGEEGRDGEKNVEDTHVCGFR